MTLVGNVENLVYIGTGTFAGTGNALGNRVVGGAQADDLNGGSGGADTLEGGLGADRLTGGIKADAFVFNTALSVPDADTITDYSVVDDTMWLKKTGVGLFNTLTLGALSADKFKVHGTGSIDSNDRILYESTTGKVFYDADGSGAGARIHFATVGVGTALTAADFRVV